jgi:hypothetical protein
VYLCLMIVHENVILTDDIKEEEFVCDLTKCKGACCVHGDSGAPLEDDEVTILEEIYQDVKPFLRQEGIEAIDHLGTSVVDFDKERVTPLVKGKECAYVVFENGVTKCGIEKAYEAGETDFRKPISCHLYPIRLQKFEHNIAVNYHRWGICADACTLGQSLKVPLYKFLKDPLIRKFGEKWYDGLVDLIED